MSISIDEYWMQQALHLAQEAGKHQEVPIGAILVKQDKVIGQGFNQPIGSHDPTAHAEILALRDAAQNQGNYRLVDSTLYVTIEPCAMCAGALVHARVSRLVFGALEPKAGAVVSQTNQLDGDHLNHCVKYEGGVCAEACASIVSVFFARRRREKCNRR
ncbi:tRNA-specific adenosine deaminase [Candidatus Endobugula sertula]|uniref:tRNA-specific adenosine deaminase n=1 Tax=Candidatus Endobugula sertula TaxID=62101 RepID=A0A1D2QT15_9GAMM|nr:tRNA-specific adenosine deaminase [Candidatus Endobugula sertula]